MKEIDIEECRKVLVKMASVFDEICRRHEIPYYMLGGTMLGAIRHRGFIPWDDDMDFGVERRFFPQLIRALTDELPACYRLKSIDNCDRIIPNFIKIEDLRTQITDNWHDGTTETGIYVDIFPLDNGRKSRFQTNLLASCIFFLLQLKDYYYFEPKYRQGIRKMVALCLWKTKFFSVEKLLTYIDRLLKRFTENNAGYMINYYGHWRKKEIIRKEVFGVPQPYPFENITLPGVADPDAYLTALFGDYMQLPPEEQRLFHHFSMYYK